MNLNSDTFVQNNAQKGSVFITFGDMIINHHNCSFEENIANFGGDFSSKPEQLRLRIYEVNEAFLYLNNTPIRNLLQSQETVRTFEINSPYS